jgi:hypothetical protein
MRVYIAVFVLCLIAAIMTRAPYPNPKADQYSESAQTQAPRSVCVSEKPDKGTNQAGTADNGSPDWHTAIKRPEWLTLFVAVVALGVIAWQAVEMRRATGAMRDSADALVNAERPWLNTTVERGPTRLEYKFSVTNLGRTPALIIGAMTCRHSGAELPEEPEYPKGMTGVEDLMNVSQNMRMLAPGEHWEFYNMDFTHYTKQFKEWELKAILIGESKFFFYGKIKYRDVFKPDALHETGFCYLYDRERPEETFLLYGKHPDYNQYT